jgi:hypothetical protein
VLAAWFYLSRRLSTEARFFRTKWLTDVSVCTALVERATNCRSASNFIHSESSPYPDFNMVFANWRRFWEILCIRGSQNKGLKTNQTRSQSNNPVTYQLPIFTAFMPGFMKAVFNHGRRHDTQVSRN